MFVLIRGAGDLASGVELLNLLFANISQRALPR